MKNTFSFVFILCSLCVVTVSAQKNPTPKPSPTPKTPPPVNVPSANALANMMSGLGLKSKPKTYKEVITEKAITQKGLFTVHKVEDKFYFEIPDTLMGREFMAVTRLSKVPSGGGYGGEIANQQTLAFEKGPNDNVFLRAITLVSVADSTQNIYKAVTNSNVNAIAAAFSIAALGKDSTSTIIDVTDFFKGDNQIVSLNQNIKKRLSVSMLAGDRSYIKKITTYPANTEIRTVKTFASFGGGTLSMSSSLPAANDAGALTMELNTSLLLLPKKPMQKRYWDKRVGFFPDDFTLYSDNQQRVENKIFAVRWRMEPQDSDYEKWTKGALVTPKKPIIYYIDPATPAQWRKYLIAGINDWQKAFEKAGFKNAIEGKEWPENDSTMSMEDARFSVIRYFASDIENAYGPNVHDPRSGEILESHIGWYHNVMKLVHNWYMIQTAAVDPKARKMKFNDTLMGSLIRFVVSHEVGHTLGLMHNMGSSSKTPVEKLRNKTYLEAYGHTASIMDYARFNYVAQPEDNIPTNLLISKIGEYDNWAIRWGYGFITDSTEDAQKIASNKLIKQTIAQNPRTWFGTYELGNSNDPRSQTEDLSDNAVKASEYGIKNLQRIIKGLPEWTKEEADLNENLSEMYSELLIQFRRYMGHVTKNVGGVYETCKSDEETEPVYEITPKTKQIEAVAFLQKQLFETPNWLITKNIWNKCFNPTSNDPIISLQEITLNNLINGNKLNQLQICVDRFGATNAYSALELLNDVQSNLFAELKTAKPIDTYRRLLQKSYADKLINIILPSATQTISISGFSFSIGSDLKKSDVPAIVRAQLIQLRNQITNALTLTTDTMSKIHLLDVQDKIKRALNPK